MHPLRSNNLLERRLCIRYIYTCAPITYASELCIRFTSLLAVCQPLPACLNRALLQTVRSSLPPVLPCSLARPPPPFHPSLPPSLPYLPATTEPANLLACVLAPWQLAARVCGRFSSQLALYALGFELEGQGSRVYGL